MKITEQIVMTTHLDRHNQRLTLGALESAMKLVARDSIPVGIEHDPRIPPIGRVRSARIVQLDDGEHALLATFEVFEDGDEMPNEISDRSIPLRRAAGAGLELQYDPSYRDEESQDLIREVSLTLGTEATEEIKKSVEPISILTLAGAFALGGMSSGFLGAVGADAYESVKKGIKRLLRVQSERTSERLLILNGVAETTGGEVEVELILTNPGDDDIDLGLGAALEQVDALVLQYFEADVGIARMVFELRNGEVSLLHCVRRDGYPLLPRSDACEETDT